MYRLVRLGPLRLPAVPRALSCDPRLARAGLRPPLCPVARRAAAGTSAKDAGVSPEKAAMDSSGETKKLNKSQQLKQVFKEYGAVGVSFHVGISLVSLGIFYLAVSSGVDMTAVLFKLGFSESSLQCKMAAGTSTFVLAYAIHKLFAPVRISITIVSVPFIVRYCRKIGFFKPPAPNP
ncbi:protein FAM210B, mitochondrial [Opisthocomus hoazin]